MYSLPIRYRLYSWLYFLIIVVACVFIYKDYGISWDEPVQRGIGIEAYKYVTEGDRTYMQMHDKIYGVGFEIPLIYLEKKLNLEDSRDIYLFRHLMNILFFAFACFIFFRLNLKMFQKLGIAIIPTLILVFSPRIFGHAFFNSKDIPFLCMYIISFYALYNYLLKTSYKNLIVLAVCAGLLVNFRIMGVLFLVSTSFLIGIYLVQKRKFRFLIHFCGFMVLSALVLYATWPYLWEKPFVYFQNAFELMSKFPWKGTLLLNGQIIHPGEKLTQYLFTWIGITIPVLYMILSAGGAIFFLIKNLLKPKEIFNHPIKLMGWVLLVHIITPVAAVLFLKSILYDDWRQLYFIYPAMVLFAGYGIYFIYNWKPKLAKVAGFISLVYIAYIGFQMTRLHPYEHIYFNELVPRKQDYIQQHYDMDYWGTSFYEGLSYLAKTDDSDSIKIFLFHDALRRNAMMLPKKDRDRIVFVQDGEENTQYYLTTFRFDYIDIIGSVHYKEIIYKVERQNSTILRVWKR